MFLRVHGAWPELKSEKHTLHSSQNVHVLSANEIAYLIINTPTEEMENCTPESVISSTAKLFANSQCRLKPGPDPGSGVGWEWEDRTGDSHKTGRPEVAARAWRQGSTLLRTDVGCHEPTLRRRRAR